MKVKRKACPMAPDEYRGSQGKLHILDDSPWAADGAIYAAPADTLGPLGFRGTVIISITTDGSLRIATNMPNGFILSAGLSSVAGRQTKFVLAMGGRLEEDTVLVDRLTEIVGRAIAAYGTTSSGGALSEEAPLYVCGSPTGHTPDIAARWQHRRPRPKSWLLPWTALPTFRSKTSS